MATLMERVQRLERMLWAQMKVVRTQEELTQHAEDIQTLSIQLRDDNLTFETPIANLFVKPKPELDAYDAG